MKKLYPITTLNIPNVNPLLQDYTPNRENTQHLYHPQIIHFDIFRIKSNILLQSYNKEDIYGWNIDGVFRYNILMASQQMITTDMIKQISHGCNQLFAHILSTGFIDQIKEWWEKHLIIRDKNIIHNILITIKKDASDIQDRNILPETISTLGIFATNDDSGIANKDLSKLLLESSRDQHIFLTKSDRNKEDFLKGFLKGFLRLQYKEIKSWKETIYEQSQQEGWLSKRSTEKQHQERNLGSDLRSFYK